MSQALALLGFQLESFFAILVVGFQPVLNGLASNFAAATVLPTPKSI